MDLCLLLGCDYLDPVKGIGPKTALKLIKEHKTLDAVLEHFRQPTKDTPASPPEKTEKVEKEQASSDAEHGGAPAEAAPKKRSGGVHFPELWPYQEARELFHHPDVTDGSTVELKWEQPNVEGLVEFLCGEKAFRFVAYILILPAQLTMQRGACAPGLRETFQGCGPEAAGPPGRLLHVCDAPARTSSMLTAAASCPRRRMPRTPMRPSARAAAAAAPSLRVRKPLDASGAVSIHFYAHGPNQSRAHFFYRRAWLCTQDYLQYNSTSELDSAGTSKPGRPRKLESTGISAILSALTSDHERAKT